MSVINPYELYKKTQIETAGQGKLILMLYEAALRNLKTATESIQTKKTEQAHKALVKSQDIIMELNITLNMDAGEIAQRLRSLYQYMHERLIEANLKKDSSIIKEITHLLAELKEAWEGIHRTNNELRGGIDSGA